MKAGRKQGFLVIYCFSAVLLLILSGGVPLLAQECGPNCPACSGGSEGSLLEPGSFQFTEMVIPWGEEEKNVMKLRYGIFSWLDAGIGYTVTSEKFVWSVRAQVFAEDKESWRPALIVGSGSVRIGGSDQSLYMQLTKGWELNDDFQLRFSGGLATLLPDFDKLYALAGATVTYNEKYSVFVNYDGKAFHPGISWLPFEWLSLSAILIESKDLALSAGLRWKFK